MKIYTADQIRTGDFPVGGISKQQRIDFFKLQTDFSQVFKTHGNNLAKVLKRINNQSTPIKDRDAGMDKGRYVNDGYVRAEGFAYSIVRFWERYGYEKRMPWQMEIKNSRGLTWEEVLTESIMLYDANEITNLHSEGKATFFHYAIESKTHDYTNPYEELNEYYIHKREDTPTPKYIILGPKRYSIEDKERLDFDTEIVPRIRAVHGDDVKIIKLNKAYVGRQKEDDGATGNLIVSQKAWRMMKLILKIENGTYRPKYII